MIFLLAIAGGLVVASLVAWFYALELNDARHTIFLVVALTYLGEALVTPEAASVSVGILRPQVAGQDFRPPDLVLMAALGVHLLVGKWGKIGPIGFTWAPFFALYLTGVPIGIYAGFDVAQVLFQGKVALYLIGGIVVASGAEVERLAASIGRLALFVAPLVPIGLILSITGARISINTPLQYFPNLGRLSHDTVTIMVVIGAAALIIEVVRERPRVWVVIAGVLLLFTPVTRDQRASYLSVAVIVIALLLLMLGATWRRRSSVGGVQVLLVLGVLLAVAMIGNTSGEPSSLVEKAFGGQGKSESAEERVSLYDQAYALAWERPFLGSGVGVEVDIKTVNTGEDLRTTAHNIMLDVWLRIGLIGLVFFVVAMLTTLGMGIHLWRTSASNTIAAVGMAGVLGMLGWLAKAFVEPALDKFRLAMLLGLAIGVVSAAWRTNQFEPKPSDVEADALGELV